MTAAADTPAAAPDVSAAGTVQAGTIEWTLDFVGGAAEQWFKAQLPAGGTDAYYALTVTDDDSYYKQFTVYTSTDPAEAGDGLTQAGHGSDSSPRPVRVQGRAVAGTAWFFVQLSAFGSGSGPSGSLGWTLTASGPPLLAAFGSGSAISARPTAAYLAKPGPLRSRSRAVLGPAATRARFASLASRTAVRIGLGRRQLRPGLMTSISRARFGLSGAYTLRAVISQPSVEAHGIGLVPDLSQNEPIDLALQLRATLQVARPDPQGMDDDGALQLRALPIVRVELPTPTLVGGLPRLPAHLAVSRSTSTAIQGVHHLHSVPDPDPIWDPRTSGWSTPPPASGAGDTRWTVQTLPDPPEGGYYWLGDASSSDGTAHIAGGARQWAPDRSTPGGPAWRSFFPYKPSVRALDAYLPGGRTVHHPKGVHLNSQYIEHMWLDVGHPVRQPFTFILAGMLVSYPYRGFTHYILGAGRDPDAVGFPRLSASATGTPRRIADGLGYDSMISAGSSALNLATAPRPAPGRTVVSRFDGALRPKMFFGVFNGRSSYVGAYDPAGRRTQRGVVDAGAAQLHQYFVLGRRQGHIAQGEASHIMLFEIRLWHRALSLAELAEQYGQLSSTYKFNQYRSL